MTHGGIITVLHHLRRIAGCREACGLTDGQLLARFLDEHVEDAFAELMRRHGPMVYGTCRRLTGNAADADDCFQAAFLVLVRQAAALRSRETVGNWLYGVAYHTALKARAQVRRRRDKEQTVRDTPPSPSPPQECWRDLQAVLDEELKRLPAKYREAVVLCDLEGKTRKEAALMLGIAAGTLSGRLTIARRRLAERLTRRGVALTGGTLAALLARNATAAVAAGLMNATLNAAISAGAGWVTAAGALPERVAGLTEGVLRMMRVKQLIVALALAVSGTGLVGAACWGLAAFETPAAAAQSPRDPPGARKGTAASDPRLAKSLEAALEDAAVITDPLLRAAAYGYIANVQSRTGQKEAAKKSLRKALDAEAGEMGAAAEMYKDSRLLVLAVFQTETGDSSGALDTIGGISAVNGDHALGNIATAMARAGDVKSALETVDRANGVAKQEGLWQITAAQADARDFKGAHATLSRIDADTFHKAAALAAVAAAYAKAKDLDAAAKLIGEARAAIPKVGSERMLALGAVAEALAASGKADDAGKLAAEIEDGLWRERARKRVVTALAARGDLNAARAVAETIESGFIKGEALKEIVTALIRAQDVPGAAKAAPAIAHDIGRCYALLEVAKALATGGQAAQAKQAIQDARDLADRLENPEGVSGVREAALAHAAGAWAATGGTDAALEWAGQQTDPWIRAMARVRIAESLAEPRK